MAVDVVDNSVLEKLYEGGIGVCMAIIGYFVKKNDAEMNKTQNAQQKTDKELSDFKLHISENYSREANTQASLGRIHDRLDDLSTDIKKLLARNR